MAHEAPHDTLRVSTRLAIGFALDLVKLAGFGRDVVDGLLIAAISQANLAQITRSPELQRAYATLDQPPPDDLRRPVSVSAIANSLRIPFETARRRISALADLGVVKTGRRGVYVPGAPLNSPFYRVVADAHYQRLQSFYFRLRAIGALEDLPRPVVPTYDPKDPPVRLVVRISTDYILRLAEPVILHIGDPMSGLILLDMFHANTEHLPDTEGGWPDGGWGTETFVADDLRRPVRVAALSARLGVPSETTRRYVKRLMERDLCERAPGGYLVPSRILARGVLAPLVVDNQSHLSRLFAGLADFGVLAEWEREIAALRGAA